MRIDFDPFLFCSVADLDLLEKEVKEMTWHPDDLYKEKPNSRILKTKEIIYTIFLYKNLVKESFAQPPSLRELLVITITSSAATSVLQQHIFTGTSALMQAQQNHCW